MAHTNHLYDYSVDGDVRSGVVVGARYELIREIGKGTFGSIWEALDLLNGHLRVAIKFLQNTEPSSELKARFAQECSALELLVPNPYIVAIRERGMYFGNSYMVMEMLDGMTLKDWLCCFDSKDLPKLSTVLSIFEQICTGVFSAHSVKLPGPIVHRDLKPENIILISQDKPKHQKFQVKILDFGLARLGNSRISAAGQQLGTPLYMAPEQVLGAECDIGPWTDVFALGVILIEMLTLRPTGPEERSLRGLVVKLGVDSALKYLQSQRSDVPIWLWNIVLRSLSAHPNQRYRDAGELLHALHAGQKNRIRDKARSVQSLRQRRFWHQLIVATVSATLGAGAMRIAAKFSPSSSLGASHSIDASICK